MISLSTRPTDCSTAQLVNTWTGGVGDRDVSLPDSSPNTAPIDGTGSNYYSTSPDVELGASGVLGQILGTFFGGPVYAPNSTNTMQQQLDGAKSMLAKSVAVMNADTTFIQGEVPTRTAEVGVDAGKVKGIATQDILASDASLTQAEADLSLRPLVTVPYPTSPAGQALQGLRESGNRVQIQQRIPLDALLPDNSSVFGILDDARDASYGSADPATRDLLHEGRKFQVASASVGHEDQLEMAHTGLIDAALFKPAPGLPAEQAVEALVEEARQRRYAAMGLLARPQSALWDGDTVSDGVAPGPLPDGPVLLTDAVTTFVGEAAGTERLLSIAESTGTPENDSGLQWGLNLLALSKGTFWQGYVLQGLVVEQFAKTVGQELDAQLPQSPQLSEQAKAELDKFGNEVGTEAVSDFENHALVYLSDFHNVRGMPMVVGLTKSFYDLGHAFYDVSMHPSDESKNRLMGEVLKLGLGVTLTGATALAAVYLPEVLAVDILLTVSQAALQTAIKYWIMSAAEQQHEPRLP